GDVAHPDLRREPHGDVESAEPPPRACRRDRTRATARSARRGRGDATGASRGGAGRVGTRGRAGTGAVVAPAQQPPAALLAGARFARPGAPRVRGWRKWQTR